MIHEVGSVIRICLDCGAVNVPILVEMTTHYSEQCMNILTYKRTWLGRIKPVYCKYIGDFDADRNWIYKTIKK